MDAGDLSDFDKGQIVKAIWLSEYHWLLGWSWSAVGSTYRRSEEGWTTNRRQGVRCPRLIYVRGQRRLSCLVGTNRRSNLAYFLLVTEVFYFGCRRICQCVTTHSALHTAAYMQIGQSAHYDPCPAPKAPIMSIWASELKLCAVEEGHLVHSATQHTLFGNGFRNIVSCVQCVSWPPNSPDLNLIEPLWDVLDQQVVYGLEGWRCFGDTQKTNSILDKWS